MMKNNFEERMERCCNLCADYREIFGVNVPLYFMFYDIDTLSDIVEHAIINAEELREPEDE